jgi:hypothetical protein
MPLPGKAALSRRTQRVEFTVLLLQNLAKPAISPFTIYQSPLAAVCCLSGTHQ